MAQSMNEMEIITRAIHTSYEALEKEDQLSEAALESLKDAENSLHKALEYVLTNRRNKGFS
ncbi:hypothetical protein KHA96_03365 [Bacillus sp. FJAT-49711]|uniref:hypothetical protein n=1 Tax=Bacillus sp. FJAT-49711 TaxID=2833585 RepID=UPI001BC9FA5B|nr:hypothetical protein [Bacillus sp. FJAT-49711]MBS4217349.1 hypothetical protein [Bacillus sp. FJAT-49711]